MATNNFEPIESIVSQHVEEVACLHHTRSRLIAAADIGLRELRRHDERIAAHLDGLAVAGNFGSTLCERALESPGTGEMFAASVRAIEDRGAARLEKLFALAEALPESQGGIVSAFGWVSPHLLEGTIKRLLASPVPFHRQVGLAACAMHRRDPGPLLAAAIGDADALLVARALRTAGELGRRDLLGACTSLLASEDPETGYWAAWSAVILDQRREAMASLRNFALLPGFHRIEALRLVLAAAELSRAHEFLKSIARDPQAIRLLIEGSGIAGDPTYVTWLIRHMESRVHSRLAGEAFTFITGAELALLDLDRNPPEDFESGPNDDSNDDNVDMDPDDGLPWPDVAKVQAWWNANGSRFQPGTRYFMGEPVNADNCRRVLRDGYQRQRIAAALYLSLLQPGTQLFPTSAPAWRQQRWLSTLA